MSAVAVFPSLKRRQSSHYKYRYSTPRLTTQYPPRYRLMNPTPSRDSRGSEIDSTADLHVLHQRDFRDFEPVGYLYPSSSASHVPCSVYDNDGEQQHHYQQHPDEMMWREVGMSLQYAGGSPMKPHSVETMPPPVGSFNPSQRRLNYDFQSAHIPLSSLSLSQSLPAQGLENYTKPESLQSFTSQQSTGDETDPIAELARKIQQPVSGSCGRFHAPVDDSDDTIAVLTEMEDSDNRMTQPVNYGGHYDAEGGAFYGSAEHESWNSMSFDLDELDRHCFYDSASGAATTAAIVSAGSEGEQWIASATEDARASSHNQPKKQRSQRKYAVKQPQKSRLSRGAVNYAATGERTAHSARSVTSDDSSVDVVLSSCLLQQHTQQITDPMAAAAIIAASGGVSPTHSLNSVLHSPRSDAATAATAASVDDMLVQQGHDNSEMENVFPTRYARSATIGTLSSNASSSGSLEDLSVAVSQSSGTSQQRKDKNRGNYKCGLCGKPKVNHICEFSYLLAKATQVQSMVIDHTTMKPAEGERVLTVNSNRKSIQHIGSGGSSSDSISDSIADNISDSAIGVTTPASVPADSSSEVRYEKLDAAATTSTKSSEDGDSSQKQQKKKKKKSITSSAAPAASASEPAAAASSAKASSGFSLWCRTETGEFNCGRIFCYDSSSKKQ